MTSPLLTVATALYFATHASLPSGPSAWVPPTPPRGEATATGPSDPTGSRARPPHGAGGSLQPLPATSPQWLAISGYRLDPHTQKLCLATAPAVGQDTSRHRRPPGAAPVSDSVFTGQPGTTIAAKPGTPSLSKLLGLDRMGLGLGGVMCVAGTKGQTPGKVSAELSREVLEQLGIRLKGDTVYYEHNVQGRGWLSIVYHRAPEHCSKEVRIGPTNPQGGRSMTLYPWFVTTPDGRNAATYQLASAPPGKGQAAYFAKVVERLAPISIRTAPDNVVVLWYEITPELLRILPPSTAHDLRCSYETWLTPEALATGLTSGLTPPCQEAKTFQTQVQEAETSIYPNPAHAEFNLTFNFGQETKVKVRLLDMAGREVRPLPYSDLTAKGNVKQTFSLDGVEPGIYLIQLEETTGGRRWSRRLVVE